MKLQKVCLINPPTTPADGAIYFPMGLLVLGTLLKANQIPFTIVDFDLHLRHHPELRNDYALFEKYAVEILEAEHADVFGIGSVCTNFPNALSLAQAMRRNFPDAKIIFGGPQPSSVAAPTMQNFPYIDAVVIGEGERTLLELLKSEWSVAALKEIPGICFRSNEGIHTTAARALIDDLDELPFPDFSLLELPEYVAQTPASALMLVEAGRGCPFRCSFCSTAEFWSRKYRAKSPARILEEMRVLHRDYQIRHFPIIHDNFTTSPKYIKKFCQYFIEHNEEEFTWKSSSRTDTLKIEDLETLKKSGCGSLFYGVDSGSKATQKAIDKHLGLVEFREVLQETLRQGIDAVTSFIIGFPDETKDDVNETLSLGLWANRQGVDEVHYNPLYPLAGTKIFHDYKDRLRFSDDVIEVALAMPVNPEVVEKVKAHPELFSSFYSIATPQLEPLDVRCLANFFFVIVNQYGQGIQWIFNQGEKKPTDLYADWLAFTNAASPKDLFNYRFVANSFGEFL